MGSRIRRHGRPARHHKDARAVAPAEEYVPAPRAPAGPSCQQAAPSPAQPGQPQSGQPPVQPQPGQPPVQPSQEPPQSGQPPVQPSQEPVQVGQPPASGGQPPVPASQPPAGPGGELDLRDLPPLGRSLYVFTGDKTRFNRLVFLIFAVPIAASIPLGLLFVLSQHVAISVKTGIPIGATVVVTIGGFVFKSMRDKRKDRE
jgi:hypothetical protein